MNSKRLLERLNLSKVDVCMDNNDQIVFVDTSREINLGDGLIGMIAYYIDKSGYIFDVEDGGVISHFDDVGEISQLVQDIRVRGRYKLMTRARRIKDTQNQ